MGLGENPIVDCGSAAASPTVEELILQLRSSFFAKEFQQVAETLASREKCLQDKCIELKKKVGTVEKEKNRLILENLKLYDELEKERKELKMKESEIDAMKMLNVEYEGRVAEHQKSFLQLRERVSSLEETAKELVGSGGTSLINLENKQQKDCAAESSRPLLFGKKGGSTKRIKSEIIEIDDDDDLEFIATLKKKRVSNEIKRECNDDHVDNIPTGTQKRKNLQELHNQPVASHTVSTPHSVVSTPCLEKLEPKNLLSCLDSSGSSSDSDNKNVDEAYKSIISRMKMRKERWGFKADMLKEFDKNDELCMNAICALHRQRIHGKRSSADTDVVPLHDISRISQLTKLITGGDPQQKWKKTAAELNRSDLDDCRRFARKYSAQLFDIYRNKDDPFFPPSRS